MKQIKAWAVVDEDNHEEIQQYQMGHGLYYCGGYRLFLMKDDAKDVADGYPVVRVLITPISPKKKTASKKKRA
jgi:hypothetical protein